MTVDKEKVLKYKELAYEYVDRVYPDMVRRSLKYHDSDFADVVIAKAIRVARNSIENMDLENVKPEEIFNKTVHYKMMMEVRYPQNEDGSFEYSQELDDFYVEILNKYLKLHLPSDEPFDKGTIDDVQRLRELGRKYYCEGISAEALLEALTTNQAIDKNKILGCLSLTDSIERAKRWDDLVQSLEMSEKEKCSVTTDREFCTLAAEYLDVVIPYMVAFSVDATDKEEVERRTNSLINYGKHIVADEIRYNGVRGKAILDTAVRFKVLEEKKYPATYDGTWVQGPDELETFYVGMLNKAILAVEKGKEDEMAKREAYRDEIVDLYADGYSAEAIFEGFCEQPLTDRKKTKNVSYKDRKYRKTIYECKKNVAK